MADPLLWCVYDNHPLQNEHFREIAEPVFQAKLRAFAHLHLNMFEIILNEAPAPSKGRGQNPSNIWFNYFRDTLSRSRVIREVLDEPDSTQIWSPILLREYGSWKAHVGVPRRM